MLKQVFRFLLFLLATAIITLIAAGIYINSYLDSNQEKILEGFSFSSGLEVAFRDLDLDAWETFPRVSFRIDSLVLRDSSRPDSELPLLAADQLSGELNLGAFLLDTLRLESFRLEGGGIHFIKDERGRLNTGNLFDEKKGADTSEVSSWFPTVRWGDIELELTDVDFLFVAPRKDKRMETHFDSLKSKVSRVSDEVITVYSDLAMLVSGIAFNTKVGTYLVDSYVRGPLDIRFGQRDWTFFPTNLQIGEQTFTVSADIRRDSGKLSRIYLANERTDYELSRALMQDRLREKLSNYHVNGRFPVSAEIITGLGEREDPEVRADFILNGNDVRILQYDFLDVTTEGRIINRLPASEGGIPGGIKNITIKLGALEGKQGGLEIAVPHALVRGNGNNTWLRSPLTIGGRAEVISERLQNENFFFRGGRFLLNTEVDASLLSFEKMVRSSDVDLQLWDVNVVYAPEKVHLPIDYIGLDKRGLDIQFQLKSKRLAPGFDLQLEGSMGNLAALLIDLPDERVDTDVRISAPRIDWTDFLAFFGQNGYFGSEDTVGANVALRKSMKETLKGLETTFQPVLHARFDTVAYYDVFTLTDFTTGLHFRGDTLVLERTDFNWKDGHIEFAAQLDLEEIGLTPFSFRALTDNLNLNRARPALEYFSLRLPAEIDSLPSKLNIDFRHAGVINDSVGVMSGFNSGELLFNDGKKNWLNGILKYRPGPLGLQSSLNIKGDSRLVNYLLATEEVAMSEGRFSLDLDMELIPRRIQDVVENGRLRTRVKGSKIGYKPMGLTVMVEELSVELNEGNARFALGVPLNSGTSSFQLNGVAEDVSTFLYPKTVDAPLSFKANGTSKSLSLTDVMKYLPERDSMSEDSVLNLTQILSPSEGIFSSLRPELRLVVDTFWLNEQMHLTTVNTGMQLRDSTELIVERSHFSLADGRIAFDLRYQLDEVNQSPFRTNWRVDSLGIAKADRELNQLGLFPLDSMGEVDGRINLILALEGDLDEQELRLPLDSASADLDLKVEDLVWSDWPPLRELGRKLKMKKRFRDVKFAPLELNLKLDSGQIDIPRTEIQSTAIQLFVEGYYNINGHPDLLISFPLRNIGRGVLAKPPEKTGYANSGWKVYLVVEKNKKGELKTRFRLGRRKFFRDRGRLEEFRALKKQYREERKLTRRQKRGKS